MHRPAPVHSVEDMNKLLTSILRSAAVWTVLGLASGLYYRELTKSQNFTGFTQLSVSHTHALTLGTIVLLIVLALAAVLPVAAGRGMRWFLLLWNAGLTLTFAMLTVKGSMQVLGNTAADSKALAGVAGLGHMTLTAAFVVLFVVLNRAVREHVARRADGTEGTAPESVTAK